MLIVALQQETDFYCVVKVATALKPRMLSLALPPALLETDIHLCGDWNFK